MTTISQVAKECGLHYDTVYRTVKQEGITATKYLTDIQADHVQQVLHNRGYFTFLTLESKLNNPDFDKIEFENHKKRTYDTETKNSLTETKNEKIEKNGF